MARNMFVSCPTQLGEGVVRMVLEAVREEVWRGYAKYAAALAAGALLAAGCVAEPDAQAPGPVRLERCADVASVTARSEGSLGARENPDPVVMDVIAAYRNEHPDTFGGTWIDRAHRVVVVAFTDDPEAHREAILAWPPPSGGDPRPLGERGDVTVDVVRVPYSKAELEDLQRQIMGAASGRDFAGSLTPFILVPKNRLSLSLFDPPEGTLEELTEMAPDPAAFCLSVSYPPPPPTGTLDLIPDLDAEDPLVICRGISPAPYSRLVDPPPLDHIDHPAVEALRAEIESQGGEPMPAGRWVVISISDDLATFAALSPDSFGYAEFERRGERWVWSGMGSGSTCEPTIALPEDLNRVEVRLDPDSPPDPDSTLVHLLVTEVACASGREMGEALQGPQVVETDTEVLVAFAAVPPAERTVNCQGNPSSPVTIELTRPLGDRAIYDGLYVPPKALAPADE